MLSIPVEYPTDWSDYDLIDSGNGEKLETIQGFTLVRPDPRALWKKRAPIELWQNADAVFLRSDDLSGKWTIRKDPPNPWKVRYKDITFTLRPTAFKHIGLFPEQASNWKWIADRITGKNMKVLNLFAYTGGATLAAAAAGATVTHVDSAKSALDWAHENADASSIPENKIRWICDDAYAFVLREGRRGNTYDGIIMDPPLFGRGNKGQVWKLAENLPKLLDACRDIMSADISFFLLNAYTADLSSLVLSHLLEDLFRDKKGTVTSGELAFKERVGGRLLPSGIFARWCKV